MKPTYRAVITREGREWLADVPEVRGAHTQARSLTRLPGYVREVVALMADLDADGFDLELSYDLPGDALDALEGYRRSADALHDAQARYTGDARTVAAALADARVSDRDAAALLGLSYQRVHQLRHEAGAA
jgi:hypothetical protein